MSLARKYNAWIICGVFKATAKRGPLGPFPMYKEINKMLPFFTTKAAAVEWCRDRGLEVPGALGIHFKRVTVECTALGGEAAATARDGKGG